MLADREGLEEAYQELRWRAYRRDPALFFRECIWIPSQRSEEGREKFELFDYQEEDFLKLYHNRFVIGLKARQIGWSTLIAAALLHRCLFRKGTVGLWVSNNQDNANKAIGMLNVMWEFLPRHVKERAPVLVEDQKGMKVWRFADGSRSRIRALAGTATAGASETASIVVLDEFALVDPNIQDNLFRSTEPTTDAGGSLWILSTARGGHNRFAKMFKAAAAGLNRFVSMFEPWPVSRFVNHNADKLRDCPDCRGSGVKPGTREKVCGCVDTSIYEAKLGQFSEKPWLIHAEYPLTPEEAFRESGNPRFSGLPREDEAHTDWVRGNLLEDEFGIRFVVDDDGPMRIRGDVLEHGPDDDVPYVLSVDPSTMTDGDYTAAHVLTWDDGGPDIVAWWHANFYENVKAARQLDMLGRYFAGVDSAALLVIESSGGWSLLLVNELHTHLQYPNLYRHIITGSTRRRAKQVIGFPITWRSRPLVIDRLAEWMQTDHVVGHIYPELRSEMATLVVTEDGKVQADVGCHDDLVMSLAVGVWLLVEEKWAPKKPSVEKPTPTPTHSLKSLFERIDREREVQAVTAARREERWNRRFERQSRRRGRGRWAA